jgi:hypothetical protein
MDALVGVLAQDGGNMTSGEIVSYMERSFILECPRMVLRKESGHRVYQGPGSIYQTPEGQLEFKLYASAPPDIEALARLLGPDSNKAGELIPHSDYFRLEATALNGDVWRGKSILPDFSHGISLGSVVTGQLYQVVRTVTDSTVTESKSGLSLRFAEDFDFPGNARKITKTFIGDAEASISGHWKDARFEAAGFTFHLEKDGGSVLLSARSKGDSLPPNFYLRICEALEFTLFDPVRWVIRTEWKNGQTSTMLRPFPMPYTRKSNRPPVGFVSRRTEEHVWRLFGKYLEHIALDACDDEHSLAKSVHFAVLGDMGPLDVGLLALSVATEGALKTGFPNLAVPDDALREQIEAAEILISNSTLNASFKPRILGSLRAMQFPRAKDRLLALQKAGVARQELVKAWEATRNPAVHADPLDHSGIEELYRNYQSALTLFNELIFLVVGYSGQYTDYSVAGWPLREFEKSMEDLSGNDQVSAPVDGAVKNEVF